MQGTHLVKKVVTRFNISNTIFIFDELIPHFLLIVNHQCGLCVLKELMSKFRDEEYRRTIFLNLIEKHFDDIVQDPYGNYAIQHTVDVNTQIQFLFLNSK